MPIYEFYCDDCNTIFSFLSRTINTTKRPKCPRCRRRALERMVSSFAAVGRAKEDTPGGDAAADDAKMERAMETLAREADGINEDDPKAAASLMRRLSGMTGMKLGQAMQEALNRMEAGEDPEQVEAELGDRLNEEEPLGAPDEEAPAARPKRRAAPRRDETLYDM